MTGCGNDGCGNDEPHVHSEDCTPDCPCGNGKR